MTIKLRSSLTLKDTPCGKTLFSIISLNPIVNTNRENAMLFIRQAGHIEIMYNAIRIGDVGKIALIFELFAPQFIGGGHDKYAIELLEFLYGTKCEMSEELKNIVIDNLLVNLVGKERHWLATNKFMEEIVLSIKNIFNPGGAHTVEMYTCKVMVPSIIELMAIKCDIREGVLQYSVVENHAKQKWKGYVYRLIAKFMSVELFKKKVGRGFGEDSGPCRKMTD